MPLIYGPCPVCGLDIIDNPTHPECTKESRNDMDTNRGDLDWLHCLMQELENDGVELPMGDYGIVYEVIETARELINNQKEV